MEGLKRYKGDSTAYANYLHQISAIIADDKPAADIVKVIQRFENYKS
jgi:hypothetical protein